MVEAANALRGQAKVRHRKQPPETVLWPVLRLCLFQNTTLIAVAEMLNLWVDGRPVASSLCVPRKRLGLEPLRYSMRLLSKFLSAEAGDEKWKELNFCAVDETQMKIVDTEDNDALFGRPGSKKGTTTAYPQVRIVFQMNVLNY